MFFFVESKWFPDWSVGVVRVQCNAAASDTIPQQRSSQTLLSLALRIMAQKCHLTSPRAVTWNKSPGVAVSISGSCSHVIVSDIMEIMP